MLERSLERDYDINYHTRAARRAFDEALGHLKALNDIGYAPWPTTLALDEAWRTWKDELETVLY
ncbi:MAG: hypothetical protein EOO61_04495 [Hymenobacter sp.]|nr:MAG: hypothetical protein EOO61_04495 [Hymenobacter sp.]